MLNLARRRLAAACQAQNKAVIARRAGVSPTFVGAVLRGRKRPGPKLLHYLGLEAFEAYRPKRYSKPS